MPKTAGIYSCSAVKSVLEIPGGFCIANDVKIGDLVLSSTLNSSDNEILKKVLQSIYKIYDKRQLS